MSSLLISIILLCSVEIIKSDCTDNGRYNIVNIANVTNISENTIVQECPFACDNGGSQCKVPDKADCTLFDQDIDWCFDVSSSLWGQYPQAYKFADEMAKNNYMTLNSIQALNASCEEIVRQYTCASVFWGCSYDANTCQTLCDSPCLNFFTNCKKLCYNVRYPDINYKSSSSSSDNRSKNTAIILLVFLILCAALIALMFLNMSRKAYE